MADSLRGARLILDAHDIYGAAGLKRIGYDFTVDTHLQTGTVIFGAHAARISADDKSHIDAAVKALELGGGIFVRAQGMPPIVTACERA